MRKFKGAVKWSKFTRRLNNLSQTFTQTETIELSRTKYVLLDKDGNFAKFTDGQIAIFGDKNEAGEQGIEFEIVRCTELSAEKQTELKLNIIRFIEKGNQ